MRLNNSVWVAIVCMNSSRAVWWTPRKSPSAQRWLRQPQFFDTRLSVGKPGAPSALPWPWALSGFSRAPRPSASHIISGGERFRLSAEDLAAKCRRRAQVVRLRIDDSFVDEAMSMVRPSGLSALDQSGGGYHPGSHFLATNWRQSRCRAPCAGRAIIDTGQRSATDLQSDGGKERSMQNEQVNNAVP